MGNIILNLKAFCAKTKKKLMANRQITYLYKLHCLDLSSTVISPIISLSSCVEKNI